jgi:hypothetical protein
VPKSEHKLPRALLSWPLVALLAEIRIGATVWSRLIQRRHPASFYGAIRIISRRHVASVHSTISYSCTCYLVAVSSSDGLE